MRFQRKSETALGADLQNSKPRQPRRRVRTQSSANQTRQLKKKAIERRRKSSERRRNEAIAQFPIITTQGICVRKDRRKIPDRRMSNIIVKETVMREEVFETLFSNYLQYKERLKLMKKLNG